MKPEIKELWVKALRSGKYEQSRCQLHNIAGYCCLGILVDCYVQQSEGKFKWVSSTDESFCYVPGLHEEYAPEFLPHDKQFREWTGSIPTDQEYFLTQMNDWKGCNFDEIADYIEGSL